MTFYSIRLEIDTGAGHTVVADEGCGFGECVAGMWADALGFPVSDLEGRLAGACIDDLQRAAVRMRDRPGHYTLLAQSCDGWAYQSVLECLCDLLEACRYHPLTRVCVMRRP